VTWRWWCPYKEMSFTGKNSEIVKEKARVKYYNTKI
jgi:hypothetical protein